jgi:DNA-binding PadR family transcriptional regulator
MRQLVLALLATSDSHGYDLRRNFDAHFGSVWAPVNDGQVYVTLTRLEKEGHISHHVVHQDDRPDRKVFTITDTGRAALTEWLKEQPTPPTVRSETMMRILAAAVSGFADHKVLIRDAKRAYRSALASLEELRAVEDPVRSLLVESAALQIEADLTWLDLADQRLKGRSANVVLGAQR